MRMSEEEYAAFQGKRTLEQIAIANGLPGPKRQKYGNHSFVVDGIRWDSKKEYARWQHLQMLQKAGKIDGLERQYSFTLADAVIIQGRRRPPLKYTCDFLYYENGEVVVEDVKSEASKDTAYVIRRHLMKSVHNIEIKEV